MHGTHVNRSGLISTFSDKRPAKVKAADKLGVTREKKVIHKA